MKTWAVVLVVFGFSYFAFTKVETRDTKLLANQKAVLENEIAGLKETVVDNLQDFTNTVQQQREKFLLLFPDHESEIDLILGLTKEDEETELETDQKDIGDGN